MILVALHCPARPAELLNWVHRPSWLCPPAVRISLTPISPRCLSLSTRQVYALPRMAVQVDLMAQVAVPCVIRLSAAQQTIPPARPAYHCPIWTSDPSAEASGPGQITCQTRSLPSSDQHSKTLSQGIVLAVVWSPVRTLPPRVMAAPSWCGLGCRSGVPVLMVEHINKGFFPLQSVLLHCNNNDTKSPTQWMKKKSESWIRYFQVWYFCELDKISCLIFCWICFTQISSQNGARMVVFAMLRHTFVLMMWYFIEIPSLDEDSNLTAFQTIFLWTSVNSKSWCTDALKCICNSLGFWCTMYLIKGTRYPLQWLHLEMYWVVL
jgi:hypothetical protein